MIKDATTENKVLGAILISEHEAPNMIKLVELDWFLDPFNRRVYESMNSLLVDSAKINVLTVTVKLKNSGVPLKIATQVSKLTDKVSPMDVLHFESLTGLMKGQFRRSQIQTFVKEMNLMEITDTFTEDKSLELIEELKTSLYENTVQDQTIYEVVDEVIQDHDKAKEGVIDGLELPYTNLHKKILLEGVDMAVIGARPGMGKTAFCISTAVGYILRGVPLIIFSLEMSKKQIVRRIMSCMTAIDSNKSKYGDWTKEEKALNNELLLRPELTNLHIYEGAHTLNDIARIVTKHKHKDKVEVFMVDYLQKITSKQDSQFDKATESSNGIKSISQQTGIPSIALAQLKRNQRGGDQRPVLSDLRNSGDIEQDATLVGFLYRPEYHGITQDESGDSTAGVGELIIAKYREGATGSYKFNVDVTTSKWKPFEGETKLSSEQEDLPF